MIHVISIKFNCKLNMYVKSKGLQEMCLKPAVYNECLAGNNMSCHTLSIQNRGVYTSTYMNLQETELALAYLTAVHNWQQCTWQASCSKDVIFSHL